MIDIVYDLISGGPKKKTGSRRSLKLTKWKMVDKLRYGMKYLSGKLFLIFQKKFRTFCVED